MVIMSYARDAESAEEQYIQSASHRAGLTLTCHPSPYIMETYFVYLLTSVESRVIFIFQKSAF